MHATIEQLIALRDNEPLDASARQHVATCSRCADQIKVLRQRQQALAELPSLAPPVDSYARMKERLDWVNQRRISRSRIRTHRYVAMAAGLAGVAAVLLGARWMNPSEEVSRVASTPAAPVPLIEADVTVQTHVSTGGGDLQQLRQRSDALEVLVTQLEEFGEARPDSGTGQAVAALREHLSVLDYTLGVTGVEPNPSAELEALWQRRVDTLQRLVAVQQAELARQGYHGFQMMTAANIQQETW